jgi:hypothetical protein
MRSPATAADIGQHLLHFKYREAAAKPFGFHQLPSMHYDFLASATHRATRGANRRAPAVLDPVQLARQGEPALRTGLSKLKLEQLKDIVADYGMDSGKLVLKWKTPERIIDRIVEVSLSRIRKGEGFLFSGSGGSSR